MSDGWRIRNHRAGVSPDLLIGDEEADRFVIYGYGSGQVRVERSRAEWVFMSVIHAISIATAQGYPRPPLALVQEFMYLNSEPWR